MILDYSCNKEK